MKSLSTDGLTNGVVIIYSMPRSTGVGIMSKDIGDSMNILSLGGGVQSTVLALMACRRELEMHPDYIMFSNTGNESSATYKHMNWLVGEIQKSGIEYIEVTGGNIYNDVMDSLYAGNSIGQPPFFTKDIEDHQGKLRKKCTSEYKINPMRKKIRQILGLKKGQHFPKGFVCNKLLGISLDEVQRMKPSLEKWEEIHWPLIEMGMTRWDCHNWLKDNGYSRPPRSACLICPMHNDSYWREMKKDSPVEFESVCKMDDNLRIGRLPGVNDDAFIHRKGIPLRDVDFTNDIDNGQEEMWKMECEGFCGT